MLGNWFRAWGAGIGVAGCIGLMLLAGTAAAQTAQPDAALRERINVGTVGLMSGGVDGTYVRIAADLAAVLDDRKSLRVMPILGKGSLQNIADVLYLRGVDVGIVQSDVLAYAQRQRLFPTLERRIRYITKLYNEEFHLLAHADIKDIHDLAGKPVNFDVPGSGTEMTASLVLDRLGIPVEQTSFDQALALDKLRRGEIEALAYVAGKPTRLFRDLRPEDGLHFLSVPLTPELLDTYLPSQLTAEDYPAVTGDPVETVAVGAVMAVYNWEPGSDRYRKVERFTDALFSRFEEFQKPPRHAKWKEVNLAAKVPGWTRFDAAESWLRRADAMAANQNDRQSFRTFLEQTATASGGGIDEAQVDALFNRFLEWQAARQ
jgi:uncharacterized protein